MRPITTFAVSPIVPDNITQLKELAYNYWWSWDAAGRELFARIDRPLWEEVGHNPVQLLNKVSQERLTSLARNSDFVNFVDSVYRKFTDYQNRKSWYASQQQPSDSTIVYFCAEFGIHESTPNYSGGLGVLAGDHLKSASDLGLPLVGMGLLYQQGYFHQYLAQNGWQNESYIDNDFSAMPLTQVLDEHKRPIIIHVDLPEGRAYARIWKMQIGRIRLFLLDSNIKQNVNHQHRNITDQLYGGDVETRIQQEIMLGMGGYRALRAMNLTPTVCHLNEGHAAYSALERIRTLMEEMQLDFWAALEIARAGNVFTTHTPVPAGNEVFSLELIEKYFGNFYRSLGLSDQEFFALGRQNAGDSSESFSMTVLGLRLAGFHNGVSKLHGKTAQKMWRTIWNDFPVQEVPIKAVSNGVHSLTWISADMTDIFDRYLSPLWRTNTADQTLWASITQVPNEELWRAHDRRRERLVLTARQHLRKKLKRFATPEQIERINDVLNPDVFTIGFARRFATYKRGTLLFGDMDRLKRLVTDSERPIQMILAGKAHPHDTPGKEMIREIVELIKHNGLEQSLVFLEDYDLSVARYMVKGCDIWLNTPRRPMEASGTSGMKAAMNGCLHVSTLDGWWDEAYNRRNGYAIGGGEVFSSVEEQDSLEREALFSLLEHEIVPTFYERSRNNVPERWVDRMKESIRTVAPYFSTARMVEEYSESFYFNSVKAVQRLSASQGAAARALTEWKGKIMSAWDHVAINEVNVEGDADAFVGKAIRVSAKVYLERLAPEDVAVEAFYGRVDSNGEMQEGKSVRLELKESLGTSHFYVGQYPCETSGLQGTTVRVLPTHELMIRNSDLYLCKWAQSED